MLGYRGQRRPNYPEVKIFGASFCVYLLPGKGKKPDTAGIFVTAQPSQAKPKPSWAKTL